MDAGVEGGVRGDVARAGTEVGELEDAAGDGGQRVVEGAGGVRWLFGLDVRVDEQAVVFGAGLYPLQGDFGVGASLLAQGVLRTLFSRASSLPPEQRVTRRSVGPSLGWHAPGPNGVLGNHRVMFEQSVRTRFKSRANAGPAGVPGALRQADHDDAGNAALHAEDKLAEVLVLGEDHPRF